MADRIQPPPQKQDGSYKRLWRIVDAAVAEALKAHPEYLTSRGAMNRNARRSITKRVVGTIHGYAVEAAKRRSGEDPAAES